MRPGRPFDRLPVDIILRAAAIDAVPFCINLREIDAPATHPRHAGEGRYPRLHFAISRLRDEPEPLKGRSFVAGLFTQTVARVIRYTGFNADPVGDVSARDRSPDGGVAATPDQQIYCDRRLLVLIHTQTSSVRETSPLLEQSG
jgi:hypothetical protein